MKPEILGLFIARLLVIGSAGWAFGTWQESAAAGLAFGLALWVLGPLRKREG